MQITKYAFSGGQDTTEEHRRLGGNTQVDVSYQYLSFLLDDDQRLEEIKQVGFQTQILLSSWFCSVAVGHSPPLEAPSPPGV